MQGRSWTGMCRRSSGWIRTVALWSRTRHSRSPPLGCSSDVPSALVSELTARVGRLPPLPQTTGVTEIYELHALLDANASVTNRDSGLAYEFAEPARAPHPEVIEVGEGPQAEALFAAFAALGPSSIPSARSSEGGVKLTANIAGAGSPRPS
jgi:hypothetical protein